MVHYIRTTEIYNLLDNFVLGISDRGILPVAWFLFSYCFLMIAGYPLWCIEKEKRGGMLSAAWLIALAFDMGKTVVLLYPQTQSLWLHLYAGYFGAGIMIAKGKIELDKRCSRYMQIVLALSVNICSMFVYFYKVFYKENENYPSFFYGKWFYTLWLVSLFWFISMVKIKQDSVRDFVGKISDNTFVVYLGHLPILLYFTNRNPIQSVGMALIMIVMMFIVCEVLAEVFRKLPMLRKLV